MSTVEPMNFTKKNHPGRCLRLMEKFQGRSMSILKVDGGNLDLHLWSGDVRRYVKPIDTKERIDDFCEWGDRCGVEMVQDDRLYKELTEAKVIKKSRSWRREGFMTHFRWQDYKEYLYALRAILDTGL